MEEKEINLWELWKVLWRRKAVILGTTFLCTVLSIGISLILPKYYRAEAVIMPLGGQKGGSGLAAAVSQAGLGGLLGGMGGGSSNSAQIMAIIKSRTLMEKVIARYDLLPVLFEGDWDAASSHWRAGGSLPNMEEAVRRLSFLLQTMDDKKTQTVKVSVTTRQPEFSARIANGMLTQLYDEIKDNAFTVQKRNRIFIEGQLERNKTDLLEVGKELSSFYSMNRISDSRAQMDVNVSRPMGIEPNTEAPPSPRSLPASLTGIDVPVMPADLQSQIDALNQQLEKVRMVRDVPQQVYLQYLTLRQELMSRMNALLTQQYEMAKIEESKEDLSFQVIDWARVPIRKDKPKRAQIVVMTFVLSCFLSCFYVFSADYFRKMKNAGT